MGSPAASTYNMKTSSISSNWVAPTPPHTFLKASSFPFPQTSSYIKITASPLSKSSIIHHPAKFITLRARAILDENDQSPNAPVVVQEKPEENELNEEVQKSVKVLKDAAKTRKVPAEKILASLSVLEKAKLDPSGFLETLGGTKSPGRTWMLIFTAKKGLERGNYFPITAVQRFDAAVKRIENGVYLGPLGQLTFEGRFSWKKRMLAFVFEQIRLKVGPFNPFEINFKGKNDREPSNKDNDPFFVWFYIDEEIAVARGRSGGTAFWVRCRRVSSY